MAKKSRYHSIGKNEDSSDWTNYFFTRQFVVMFSPKLKPVKIILFTVALFLPTIFILSFSPAQGAPTPASVVTSLTATRTVDNKVLVQVTTMAKKVIVKYKKGQKVFTLSAKILKNSKVFVLPVNTSRIQVQIVNDKTPKWLKVRVPKKISSQEYLQYAFISVMNNGEPTRWNPCAPLKWKVISGGDSAENARLVDAFTQVSKATGVTFVQVQSGSADINIDFVWSTGYSIGGYSGISWTTTEGGLSSFNPAAVHFVLGNKVEGRYRTKVYLHEFGHVMGLTHVGSEVEILSNTWKPSVLKYGPGDLAGLAKLGTKAGCLR